MSERSGRNRPWPARSTTWPRPVSRDLYRGDVGRELAADFEETSCRLVRDDLRRVDVRWRKPASLAFGRNDLDVAPNRRGIELALALGLAAQRGPHAAEGFDHWHGMIESAKLAHPPVRG